MAFRTERPRRAASRTAALLAALLLCLFPQHSYAYYYVESYAEDIAVLHQTFKLQLWHYSGGYWMGSDINSKDLKISDRQIDAAGICGYLNCTQYVSWTAALPAPVREEIRAGSTVSARAEGRSDLYKGTLCSISGAGSFTLYARPVFHVATCAGLNSFVSGIKVTIPLVSSSYGRNLYSLYSLKARGVAGPGMFRESEPDRIIQPYLHPSQIKDRFGILRSGYMILAGSEQVRSGGWSVGLMTLMRGGAVGLEFDFPVDIIFSAERQVILWADEASGQVADVPEDPDPGGSQASQPFVPPAQQPPPEYWQEEDITPAPVFDPWMMRLHRLY